jgi:ribosomal protein S27E
VSLDTRHMVEVVCSECQHKQGVPADIATLAECAACGYLNAISKDAKTAASEQTLYRYWAGETLLYVGISINAYNRAKQHQGNSKWWPEATHVTFEKFSSRQSVEDAEKAAIKAEKPLYNVTHNGPKLPVVVQSKTPKSSISGLWGFDLITQLIDGKEKNFPGRVYQIRGHVHGETYLLDFHQVSFTSIGGSLGMTPTKLSDLVNPHLFTSKSAMIYEFKDWWRDYDFWNDYQQRKDASEVTVEVTP